MLVVLYCEAKGKKKKPPVGQITKFSPMTCCFTAWKGTIHLFGKQSVLQKMNRENKYIEISFKKTQQTPHLSTATLYPPCPSEIHMIHAVSSIL